MHGDTLPPHCALGSAGSTHRTCPQGKAGKAGLAVGLPTREEQSLGPQAAPVGGILTVNSPGYCGPLGFPPRGSANAAHPSFDNVQGQAGSIFPPLPLISLGLSRQPPGHSQPAAPASCRPCGTFPGVCSLRPGPTACLPGGPAGQTPAVSLSLFVHVGGTDRNASSSAGLTEGLGGSGQKHL